MKAPRIQGIRAVAAAVLLLPFLRAPAQEAAAAAPAAPRAAEVLVNTPPVPARIWQEKESRAVTLVGVGETTVATAATPESPAGRMEIAQVTRVEFAIDLDGFELSKALRRNDWPAAARLLQPALKPVLPYLALPENNAASLALDLGTYMTRAAERTTRGAQDDAQRELARKQYEAAYDIFKACAAVNWSSIGQLGVLKGCRVLLALNKVKTAQFHVDRTAEPAPGDAAYGHYWLIRGELEYRAGRYREALDAVLKSVCFANKDVETFPDALLLSARCYEEMVEPYRARDVYYEVAKLFPRSDWSAVAVARLHAILDQGLTREKEKSTIENAFFKTSDDVNKLVEQLFKDLEKPPAEEAEEDSTSSKPKAAAAAPEPEEQGTLPGAAPDGTPPPAAAPAVAPVAAPAATTPRSTTITRTRTTTTTTGSSRKK